MQEKLKEELDEYLDYLLIVSTMFLIVDICILIAVYTIGG